MISQTLTDRAINHVDSALRSLFAHATESEAAYPAAGIPEATLSHEQRQHSAALMRINHSGEICAQALYQGQALTARDQSTRAQCQQAAHEERDHLAWCQQRLNELDDRPSALNPAWYLGSLAIGSLAGLAGDQWSLGFIHETEHQVVRHLESHLDTIAEQDQRSRAIIQQMRTDEAEHAELAASAGAHALPAPIKSLMTLSAKIMTTLTYYW